MKHSILSWVVLLILLPILMPHNANAESTLDEIRAKGFLTVCMDIRNLPYSNADPGTSWIIR